MKENVPHRHIGHIEFHNRNSYVLTYVPMCLSRRIGTSCGKKIVFRDPLKYSTINDQCSGNFVD